MKHKKNIINNFKPEHIGPDAHKSHHPHTMVVTCVDSRDIPHKVFHVNENEILVIRNPGAVIPPYEHASLEMQAAFSLRELKEIQKIILMPHADCGGAQIFSNPNLQDKSQRTIAKWVGMSGAEVNKVTFNFKPADLTEKGLDPVDRLALEIGKNSLKNFMAWPDIESKIITNQLDVSLVFLVFLDFKNNGLRIYDAEENVFNLFQGSADTHFCHRRNECMGCSCIGRMQKNTGEIGTLQNTQ